MGSLYGDKVKFFREGIEADALTEIPKGIELEFSPVEEAGECNCPVRYREIEGVARYCLINWAGKKSPSVLFHHGSGENNYTKRIRKIFQIKNHHKINVIAVSIPFNRNLKEYLYGIGSLQRFSFLIASSTQLTESLGAWLKNLGSEKIVVSGISLGGWITNLHYSLYGSLDEYRPIFAGAALGHLFTDTIYREMSASPAKEHPEILKEALNFEDSFRAKNPNIVFPLLSRYDQFIHFERQKGIYLPENTNVLEKGHITGSMAFKALRNHIFDKAFSK